MKIIPLTNKLLIEIDGSAEKKRISGLIILKTTEDKAPQIGKVIAKGPDVSKIFKVGDTVLFEKYAGDEINDTEEHRRYLIIEEDSIIATYEA